MGISVSNLTKNYGDVLALDDVTLKLDEPKIYALLGKNGAGKSTLVSIITNRVFATKGQVLINGMDAKENDKAQSSIFCMSESGEYPPDMKVRAAFKWAALYYPSFDAEYAKRLCTLFSLDASKKIGKLSTGYKSIYKLILTLASGVDICIFDEPALGLDATMREVFYCELLRYYSENPKIIIIATHLIEEISKLVEHVFILKDGKLIIDQSIDEFIAAGHKLSGKSEDIDAFIKDKKLLRQENMGNLKNAIIFGELSKDDRLAAKNANIDIAAVGLQEMFVSLTR